MFLRKTNKNYQNKYKILLIIKLYIADRIYCYLFLNKIYGNLLESYFSV